MPIINGQGRVAVRVQVPLLLDTYTGAAAAYSLRKLSNTYNGPAIRVRRSSNNAELNIGFNSDGTLDTTTLLLFVGGGDGFVTTWYDQSGNGKDASNNGAIYQPQIVTSGVVDSINGKPAIKQTGNQYLRLLPPPYGSWNIIPSFNTLMFVNEPNTSLVTSNGPFGGNIVVSDGYWTRVVSYDTQAKAYMTYIGAGGTYTGASANYNLFYVNTRGGKMYMSFDGNSERDMGNWNASNNTVHQLFAVPGDYNTFKGKYNELILWTGDKSANRSAISSNINTYYSIYSPMDSDVQAFITAASISDSTQQSAVNTLVTSLKSAGIWTKMKAIYPFVGGTATSHSYNLINTAQYRITWSGGLTHSSTGVLPNGTNGWGYWNTVLTSSLGLLPNNLHISSYVRTNDVSTNAFEIQIKDNGYNNHVLQAKNPNNNSAMYSHTGIPGYGITSANPDSRGFYIGGATSSSSTKFYKNGTLIGSSSGAQSTFPGMHMDLALFGSFSGGATREQAFASLGTGLTDAEASAFYTAVQAFQTTLGRQV